jgi:hypothetical protein
MLALMRPPIAPAGLAISSFSLGVGECQRPAQQSHIFREVHHVVHLLAWVLIAPESMNGGRNCGQESDDGERSESGFQPQGRLAPPAASAMPLAITAALAWGMRLASAYLQRSSCLMKWLMPL